jgi:hypothetical protein
MSRGATVDPHSAALSGAPSLLDILRACRAGVDAGERGNRERTTVA